MQIYHCEKVSSGFLETIETIETIETMTSLFNLFIFH